MDKLDIDNNTLMKATDGAIVCLSTIQEMIADHDERLFSSVMISRLEEVKAVIKLFKASDRSKE